jgi:hypothetical protein
VTDSTADDRELGIDFGTLDAELERIDYPVTTEALVDDYGDRTLEFESGKTTLAAALTRLGDQTFESRDAVREALYAAVGEEAVGRTGYTDRGTGTPADGDASF